MVFKYKLVSVNFVKLLLIKINIKTLNKAKQQLFKSNLC